MISKKKNSSFISKINQNLVIKQSTDKDYEESALKRENISNISFRLNFQSIGKSKTSYTA